MLENVRGKRTKVGNFDVSYFLGGQGEPLIIIHGGGDGATAWVDNLAELSKYYTVYAPDLPGFGHSQPISDDFHISEYVEFIEDFSHNLGLQSFHLMGHSIGGGIALQYALRFPHRIKKFRPCK